MCKIIYLYVHTGLAFNYGCTQFLNTSDFSVSVSCLSVGCGGGSVRLEGGVCIEVDKSIYIYRYIYLYLIFTEPFEVRRAVQMNQQKKNKKTNLKHWET